MAEYADIDGDFVDVRAQTRDGQPGRPELVFVDVHDVEVVDGFVRAVLMEQGVDFIVDLMVDEEERGRGEEVVVASKGFVEGVAGTVSAADRVVDVVGWFSAVLTCPWIEWWTARGV